MHFPYDGIEISAGAKQNTVGGNITSGSASHGEGNIITLNGDDGIDINGAGTMSNTIVGNLIGVDVSGAQDLRVQTMVISPVYAQDQTLFIGTQRHGVWKTTNGGISWTMVSSGLTDTNVLALAISPNYNSDHTLFAATFDGGIFRSMNAGASWLKVDLDGPGDRKVSGIAISSNYASDGTVFAVSSQDGILVSTDRGATWIPRISGIGNVYWTLRGVAISPNYASDQTVFVYAWDRIFKSTDRGQNWTAVSTSVTGITSLVISPGYASDFTVLALLEHCGAKQTLLKSPDAGGHWEPFGGILNLCGLDTLVLSPNYTINKTMYIGAEWKGVARSVDGGTTFSQVRTSRFNRALVISPSYAADHTVFVGEYNGQIGKSTNSGSQWSDIGTQLAEPGNHNDGVRIDNGAQWNVIGSINAAKRNVISNNGEHGVAIENLGTNYNQVIGNYIGLRADGLASLGNDTEGIVINSGAQFNRVGGALTGERNIISGNAMRGVALWDQDTMSNTVAGNYIGTDYTGMKPVFNNGVGIVVSARARFNLIGGSTTGDRNVISGNADTGIGLWDSGTTDNAIIGNYIGVATDGMTALPNFGNGIGIGGSAQYNRIGGTTSAGRNVIAGNRNHGIYVGDPGTRYITITGNYVGIGADGLTAIPNLYSGVVLDNGAQYNHVGGTTPGERNVLSGNQWDGISVWGDTTFSNTISGNYIGLNSLGTAALPNSGVGVAIRGGAQFNRVGGSTSAERNVISGNRYEGVGISNANSQNNIVAGNYIGTDPRGAVAIGNHGSGVLLSEGTQFNRIGGSTVGERNLVSGNFGHGVVLWSAATSYNVILGNYVGLDASGSIILSNQASGIAMDAGAQYNRIGGTTAGERNVISGNFWDGVSLWKSTTMSNTVVGNYIGTDATGMSMLSNRGVGVALRDGASLNVIGGTTAVERNLISGNHDAGIGLADATTLSNTIIGNYIGLNATGTLSLGNRWGIACWNDAQFNIIKNNVIAGSLYSGIHFDSCDRNTISANIIGSDPTGAIDLSNGDHGINLYNGSQQNVIGPNNLIAYNSGRGVSVWDTSSLNNKISHNSIHSNGQLGIENGSGGNLELTPPTLLGLSSNTVTGVVSLPYATIEILSDNATQGRRYEGTTVSDSNGNFSFTQISGFAGPYLTAVVIDSQNNTSRFSIPLSAIPPVPPLSLSVSGPLTGSVDTALSFTATVNPAGATLPLTYIWSASDQQPITLTGQAGNVLSFMWASAGLKQITVTVSNNWGTTTGTGSVAISDTQPMTTTGYAISIPITPTSLIKWDSITLTTRLPWGASMQASVLDASSIPLFWLTDIPVSEPTTTINLNSVNPSVFQALRLRVDLTSVLPGRIPELLDWRLNWESVAEPHYQVAGHVFDGYGHSLIGVNTELLQAGNVITETTTDEEGGYAIGGIAA